MRPKPSSPSTTIAKFKLLLSIFGNGRAGSSASGLNTGSTSRMKYSAIQAACASVQVSGETKTTPFLRELRHEHVVQHFVLLVDQAHGARADRLQLLGHGQPVRPALDRAGLQQLLEARDANLEELVEIRAGDAQESDPLEQRNAAVLGLFQHPLIEFQKRQFAIDVELRNL